MADPDNEWDDIEAGRDATGAMVGPTRSEASSREALREQAQAGGEARGTEDAPIEGGKATAREEEVEGRAQDTTQGVNGNYLEPPD